MNKKHVFIYKFLRPLVILFLKIKFGYTYSCPKNELPDNYIVLSNHVTDYDPVFVGSAFPNQMYFVASEHISRWKHWFGLLNFALAPILRHKGSLAVSTVKDILTKAKNGCNVAIFAEGVRTWDGVTCPILPSTGKMVKKAGCGLVTFRLTGGYFVSPHWSTSLRKGPVSGAVVNIYTKEQLAEMSIPEINAAIKNDLYEDAYARQLADPKKYKSKHLAEGFENLLFICPECGGQDTFSSLGDTVTCSCCGHSFKYNEYGMLVGSRFNTVRELAMWQEDQIANDLHSGKYGSKTGTLAIIESHQENIVAEGPVTMTAQSLICGETEIPVNSISEMDIHGNHAIVFTVGKEYYELKPSGNAYKFLVMYRACKNASIAKAQ
ncbi:MAG: hypothetical protein E7430_08760 [Ruminococcaceae bacterium]|nr:hypothetical protein [Oscillospiraceae bacterium]